LFTGNTILPTLCYCQDVSFNFLFILQLFWNAYLQTRTLSKFVIVKLSWVNNVHFPPGPVSLGTYILLCIYSLSSNISHLWKFVSELTRTGLFVGVLAEISEAMYILKISQYLHVFVILSWWEDFVSENKQGFCWIWSSVGAVSRGCQEILLISCLIPVIGSDSPLWALFLTLDLNRGYIKHAKPTQEFCIELWPGPPSMLQLLLMTKAAVVSTMTLQAYTCQWITFR